MPVANHLETEIDVRNACGAILVHKKTMTLTMFLLENLIEIPAPMGFSLWNKDIRSQSSCKPSCLFGCVVAQVLLGLLAIYVSFKFVTGEFAA